ncbi:MAG: hypothetical protein LQ351_005262 [Letrouitia transgressa]|nr:MAG: hypothetical protein LQ351_005262 [Letrouitia transgressa]
MPRVFLITGTSTGFGQHLVQTVLDAGDIAVATARKPEGLSFRGTNAKNYLALKLDVTKKEDIENAFQKTLSQFGRVDVVVNNAGYGLSGPFEELDEAHVRMQMEVNFFGLIAVTKKAMEVLREQKPSGGLIQQITSIGGQRGVPTFSIYNASKWAVEGFTEAVSQEVKPEWAIKFTCVEPGGFRTDWSGRSMSFPEKRNPAYDHIDARQKADARHGTQAGDPIKGAKAMYELATLAEPPLRVVIDGRLPRQNREEKPRRIEANNSDGDGIRLIRVPMGGRHAASRPTEASTVDQNQGGMGLEIFSLGGR